MWQEICTYIIQTFQSTWLGGLRIGAPLGNNVYQEALVKFLNKGSKIQFLPCDKRFEHRSFKNFRVATCLWLGIGASLGKYVYQEALV